MWHYRDSAPCNKPSSALGQLFKGRWAGLVSNSFASWPSRSELLCRKCQWSAGLLSRYVFVRCTFFSSHFKMVRIILALAISLTTTIEVSMVIIIAS